MVVVVDVIDFTNKKKKKLIGTFEKNKKHLHCLDQISTTTSRKEIFNFLFVLKKKNKTNKSKQKKNERIINQSTFILTSNSVNLL